MGHEMRHLTANAPSSYGGVPELSLQTLSVSASLRSRHLEHACPITTKQGRTHRRAASPLALCSAAWMPLSRDAANPAFSPTGTACCRSAHRHFPANHRVRNSARRPRRSTTAIVASNVPSRTERIASNTCNTISTHEHARTRNNH